MKTLLSALLVLFSCGSFLYAQNATDGLVLRGRIYDGKYKENKNHIIWQAKLAMEFSNQGTKSIILINPTLQFGTGQSKLDFYIWSADYKHFRDVAFERLGLTTKPLVNLDTVERLRLLAKDIDQQTPPDNWVTILKSGESFSFEDNLNVTQQFTVEKYEGTNTIRSRNWEGSLMGYRKEYPSRDKGFPVMAFQGLRIEYTFQLSKYGDDPDLLEKLSLKWKTFGTFPVDNNGSYAVRSERIDIDRFDWKSE